MFFPFSWQRLLRWRSICMLTVLGRRNQLFIKLLNAYTPCIYMHMAESDLAIKAGMFTTCNKGLHFFNTLFLIIVTTDESSEYLLLKLLCKMNISARNGKTLSLSRGDFYCHGNHRHISYPAAYLHPPQWYLPYWFWEWLPKWLRPWLRQDLASVGNH